VNRHRAYDIAIIGGGSAGLVAALAASQEARTVLILDRPPDSSAPLRIDVVPARTLALLVELGIEPRAIGVERLHDRQEACWATASPQWSDGLQTAHIERPALELALYQAVRADSRIEIVVDAARPKFNNGFVGAGWRAKHFIDATGRASVTARARVRPRPVWASRFFWTARRRTRATPEFRIAALSCGYAYRLGSAQRIGIGVVGRGKILKSDPEGVVRILRDESSQWLCEGMPPLTSMARGACGIASVQWAEPGQAVLVGDASIARDSLSSQGLAASLSDALYAVAAITTDNTDSLRIRQTENLSAHLSYLKEQLTRCRHRDSPLWTAYEKFIAMNINASTSHPAPALRHGRLESSPINTVASHR
jgi:2-polyprenyl-6-methoxyphenol hydroxylase-like FAD-dependent oxidoreductase